MGKEGTGGLFSHGEGGEPSWWGGAQDCKIALQACTCHANLPGTIGPRRGLGWGEPGKDAGTALMGGPLLALIPEQTPNVLIQLGSCGSGSHPVPPCGTFHCSVHGVFGKDVDQGVGDTHCSTCDFSPLQSTPVLCCVGTYSHTPFKSRTTPLSGFVGAAQGWAPQDSGHPGVCGQPWDPEPLVHRRLLGVRETELGGVRPPCPHSFVPTFPGVSCPSSPEAGWPLTPALNL